MRYTLSQRLSHFFHVVSDIRPIIWMGLYISIIPIFALIYWALPDTQFRFPENAPTDYGSWLYYSVVTITTLGFGDYTPAHGVAQCITGVEVFCGIAISGLFINAVGAMKSEIDVESEIEKQKQAHEALEQEKLLKSTPSIIHSINTFLAYCFAVTTPLSKRKDDEAVYNPNFTLNDLRDLFQPSGLPIDRTDLPAVERLLKSAGHLSLVLDSLQQKIDLTIWPKLLELCFAFVANCQLFSNTEVMFGNSSHILTAGISGDDKPAQETLSQKIAQWEPTQTQAKPDSSLLAVAELGTFIKENAKIARSIETFLTEISSEKSIATS